MDHEIVLFCGTYFKAIKFNTEKLTLTRVARFFSVHYTKTLINVPNEYNMYQMVIKYSIWP
jgi:hypothetical protein